MDPIVQKICDNNDINNQRNSTNSPLKVICLDLDETLIRATRVACNNTGSKQLKYWGQRISRCRENELKELLQNKPLDCSLNDEEYLKMKYGTPLFEDNPDIASPYRWSFPTDDFSKCWTLIRCYNQHHKMTSFYRIEYRPYCQHLIEIINKYKKHCSVKVVISTMATRQYGMLVCEGFKLFKGYFANINGESKPFIDEFIGLEDWRENCWDRRYPLHYGKKSLSYIGLLFGIDPSQIVAIDDKPQIWTNMKQVIHALPYNGGIYLTKQKNKEDDVNYDENDIVKQNSNEHINGSKIDDFLYKIAKYFESYLYQTTKHVLSKQRRQSEQYNKKTHLRLRSQSSNPVITPSKKHDSNKNNKNANNNSPTVANNVRNENKNNIINIMNNNPIDILKNETDTKNNTLISV